MTKPLKSTTPGGEALVTITLTDYERLTARAEDIVDAAAIAEQRNDPRIPQDLAQKVWDGSLHPLAAWRKAAGLTQAALAEKAHIRTATVADIERGKIDPRVSTMAALAGVLDLDIDDLLPPA